MRPFHVLLGLSALVAAGCVEPVPPVFEEPVPLATPSSPGSMGARLTVGFHQQVLLSWMERQESGATLRVSSLGPSGWLEPVDIVTDPKMFVNWADLPSVTALGGDRLLAHWLSYSADETYSYDTLVVQSDDAGETWSAPVRPHSDGTTTEHGFVSVWPRGPAGGSGVGLLWLDGRNTEAHDNGEDHSGGMTLRSATIDARGELSDEQEIDQLVCDCCQTDVAIAATGPIAVYRDRTSKEIRDIYMSRFKDGIWQSGEAFSNDGWTISACPVNGPAIAASDRFVAVAWFTAANDKPLVKIRLSNNGGKRFGDAVVVADKKVIGHVDVAYIGDSSFAVSWLEEGGELDNVQVRSVTAAGGLGKVKNIGRTAVSLTVPQMIHYPDRLYFVWTDTLEGKYRLASVRADVVLAQ